MSTEAQRPSDVPANLEKRMSKQDIIIAATPAVIAALASIIGLVVGEINHARTVDKTNEINQLISEQTNKINVNIATSNNNATMLNELIQHQLLPYRDKVVELLGTVKAEFNRICKLPEPTSSDKLEQALDQLGDLTDRPPYQWDKGVLQKMKTYNEYVVKVYVLISRPGENENPSTQARQEYNQEALHRRESLLDAIDAVNLVGNLGRFS
jgi:hypothetical protein